MKKIVRYIRFHWYGIALLFILTLSFILRFYGYSNRWGLAYDQAHDALVARAAVQMHTLPILGPFSSAGAFVTGPEWYWFIMVGVLMHPNFVMMPWILLALVFVCFVLLIVKIGELIDGKELAIIVGLLSAVSFAEITQAVNLTNQSLLSILSALSLLFVYYYIKQGKERFIFLLGFFVSLGINMHLQGILLFTIILFTVLVRRPMVKGFLFLFFGIIIPFIPLILFDVTHHFFDSGNFLQYYFHDQYKIPFAVLGRRWLTYAAVFWPHALGEIIGGYSIFGYFLLSFSIPIGAFLLIKKKISKIMIIILFSFFLAAFLMRYTRTPLFSSYLMFLHPWVFFIFGWIFLFIYRKTKIIGILVISIFLLGSVHKDISDIRQATNYTAAFAVKSRIDLIAAFPNKKFSLYNANSKTLSNSLSLSLFLSEKNLIDDKDGIKIGLMVASPGTKLRYPLINTVESYKLVNLENITNVELQQQNWARVNPSDIYTNTEEWFKRKKI